MSQFRCRDCNSLITTSDNIRPLTVVDGYGNPIGCLNCGSYKLFREFDQLPEEEAPEGAPTTDTANSNIIPHPPSNSKSEDTPTLPSFSMHEPLSNSPSPSKGLLKAIEPPQDTSLDYIFDTFTVNGEGDCVVDRTSMQEAINSWHKAQQAKLLQVIEDEVIGEDEKPEIPVNDYYWRFRNELKAKQRQVLKKIKERL